jgi:hypothetical protein
MANLKHIGQVTNTGIKCVVLFREIYDDRGNVQDHDHCLVVETDRLPDYAHDDVVRVVESVAGQEANEFYEIANRSYFSDGAPMLQEMHKRGWIKKYPTTNITLTPNRSTGVLLSEVNEVIRKQKTGMSERDIRNTMTNDTDQPPRTQTTLDPTQTIDQAVNTNEQALDDTAIAQGLLSQAETFLAEAERLKAQAYEMDPNLKPKRGRKPKKATANADT